MGTTAWKVEEGKETELFDNYSKARDTYLNAVKHNKALRASKNIFTRLRAKRVVFAPLN